jgi:hypothetical protein
MVRFQFIVWSNQNVVLHSIQDDTVLVRLLKVFAHVMLDVAFDVKFTL